MSYFNEVVGGPKGGPEHLLLSNVDWSQDLLYFKEYLDNHPGVKLDGMKYYGNAAVTLSGIPEVPLPPPGPPWERETVQVDHMDAPGDLENPAMLSLMVSDSMFGPKPGRYALSVNEVYDRSLKYAYFKRFEPVAMAGYSIYIYDITLDEANRVRREFGLPELPRL